MCLDNRAANRQAHPHAMRFCGEERIEYPVDVFRLDSLSSVLHRKHYVARVVNLGFHAQHPRPILSRHRINRIRNQVQEHLLHLNSIPFHRGSCSFNSAWTVTRCLFRSSRTSARASLMSSLISSEVLFWGSFLNTARTPSIIAPARWPSWMICLSDAFALSRSGVVRSSQRTPASAFAIIPDNGCLI